MRMPTNKHINVQIPGSCTMGRLWVDGVEYVPAEEVERLRDALAWTGEVVPERSNPNACVSMTWEEFNRMRELIGRQPIKALGDV
jgi:hypothetical protein